MNARRALAVIGIAGVLAVVVLRRWFVAVTVRGSSMTPTYVAGERVLVRRASAHALQRGQVVVFADPDSAPGVPVTGETDAVRRSRGDVRVGAGTPGWMIKRVVAIPGDPVPRRLVPLLADRPEAAVPSDRLVVLGDNPNGSFDSRKIGYVPGDRVLGMVIRRLGGPRSAEGDG